MKQSTVKRWRKMFSALGAIAAGISAATAVGGTVIGSQNAQQSNNTQRQIANNTQQNAQNQQQYQAALNALALQRSTASQTDGMGNTMSYDPATNSWKTTLSPVGQQLQTASNQAAVSRDTTDLATSQEANNKAMQQAIAARTAAGPALAAVQNFKPLTSQGLEGALQQTATTANRQAEDPVIADTLRSFERSGTAAAPVLTSMMRDNATSLRQTMLGDQIDAMKNVGGINAQNLGSLDNNYTTLNNAAKPALNFSPIAQADPSGSLAAEMSARAGGAASPASQGAYSAGIGTNASNNAGEFAALHPGSSNLGASIVSAGGDISKLFSPTGALASSTNGSSGPSWLSNLLGTSKQDGFGNTVGQDNLTPNWQNTMFGGLNPSSAGSSAS